MRWIWILSLIFQSTLCYSQTESETELEKINTTLNICFEDLSEDNSVIKLQNKLGNDLCSIALCTMNYSISNYLNLDSLEVATLKSRILEINTKFFERGTPLKLYLKGGVGGGSISFNTLKDHIEITLPTTCIVMEPEEKLREIYSIINSHTDWMLSLEN